MRRILPCVLVLAACSSSGSTDQQVPAPANPAYDWAHFETTHRAPILPILVIDTGGFASVIPRDKIKARLKVIEKHDGTHGDLSTAPVALDLPIGINLRGSSSAGFLQRPYTIELHDDLNEGKKVPVLDLPPGEDFALVSCWTDKPCMRNALAYAMGRQLGRWNPKLRFVEVYLDGVYNGLYQMTEAVRQDKRRVDVPKPALSADLGDITGGYIIRREAGGKAAPTTIPIRDWLSPVKSVDGRQMVYTYHYPKEDKITAEQKAYIQDYFTRFETAMKEPTWIDPQTGYRKWLDVATVVDFVLMNEISNNVDAYWKSVYMAKQRDSLGGKMALSPLWDYNIAFGNADYRDGWKLDNVTYKMNRWGGECSAFLPTPMGCSACIRGDLNPGTSCWTMQYVPFWLDQLWTDPVYTGELKCRWLELRKGAFDMAKIDVQLEAWRRELGPAMRRHFARWERLLTYNWPNWYISSGAFDFDKFFDDEVDYLRNWTANRIMYLDKNLPGTCSK